ncbi:TPA: hypothetical protein ACOEMI_003976 [Enterobacter ludwigii]
MQLQFINIPYAVTLPDDEIVDINYSGDSSLVCEFCGVGVFLVTRPDGTKSYEHRLPNQSAICHASACKYRHLLLGDWQPYHALKPLGHGPTVPAWVTHRPPYRTVERNWRCRLCHHRYFGNKQCPRCHDWTCTVEA